MDKYSSKGFKEFFQLLLDPKQLDLQMKCQFPLERDLIIVNRILVVLYINVPTGLRYGVFTLAYLVTRELSWLQEEVLVFLFWGTEKPLDSQNKLHLLSCVFQNHVLQGL